MQSLITLKSFLNIENYVYALQWVGISPIKIIIKQELGTYFMR